MQDEAGKPALNGRLQFAGEHRYTEHPLTLNYELVRLEMVHPDTELRFVSPAIGWGVFATRDIPTGTITWALDALDQHFSDEDMRRLPD
jgi:hypothetical protein